MTEHIAVFPGSFDPLTYGHLDIIARGASLFDRLVVGVSQNPGKSPLLPLQERLRLIRELTAAYPNVTAASFEGMTVDFVRSLGSRTILRGIRTFADFEYEFQLALANRTMGDVETVFVMASAENAFVRSTLIKEAVALGADVSNFVPPAVVALLRAQMPARERSGIGLDGEEPPSIGGEATGLRGESIE